MMQDTGNDVTGHIQAVPIDLGYIPAAFFDSSDSNHPTGSDDGQW